jgi:hypothetical protein
MLGAQSEVDGSCIYSRMEPLACAHPISELLFLELILCAESFDLCLGQSLRVSPLKHSPIATTESEPLCFREQFDSAEKHHEFHKLLSRTHNMPHTRSGTVSTAPSCTTTQELGRGCRCNLVRDILVWVKGNMDDGRCRCWSCGTQ